MNPRIDQQRKGTIALIVFLTLGFGVTSGILIATGLDWIPHSAASSQPAGGTVEPSQFLINTQESFRQLADAVRPAVVSIEAKGTQTITQQDPFGGIDPFQQFFGFPFGTPDQNQNRNRQRQYQAPQVAAGSGFIVDPKGYILTNNHVVEGADEVTVKTEDGRNFSAQIVGTDPETDVAVLKIEDNQDLPYIAIGDSDGLQVGDWVMAIGNPFGYLAGTVTVGIVSARNREDLQLPSQTVYKDYIQTDAAINLGNSGGPLVDIYGRVVGINTAISAQGSGIGFAIPINMAKSVYEDLVNKGEVVRSWIGVSIQNLDEDLANNLGLPDARGALVGDVVQGDPAERAGLQAGDVILDVEGTRVTSSQSASRTIAALPVGEPADFKIWRDGHEETITITPVQRPADVNATTQKPDNSGGGDQNNRSKGKDYLGIEVQNLSSRDRQQYGIPDNVTGVVVSYVDPSSPALEKGLSEGMIIGTINHTDIANVDDYDRLMAEAETAWQNENKTVLLRVHTPTQDGRWVTQFLAVPFE
jgi:serine protease Do